MLGIIASALEWSAAVEAKQPLAGRAVLITFDDGYLDFLIHAWPLLGRYGFTATVFLVTDAIGQSNAWDGVYGEEIRCLGGKILVGSNVRVEFGSHSATHRALTTLSPADVVREGAFPGRFSNVSWGYRSTPSPIPMGIMTRSSGTSSGRAATYSGCHAGPI
jgi:peptidoglycan/xylan/chitin deacetylase (PgdA/CDA1 family)